MVKSILIVGLGGFIGSVFRFLISRYVQLTYDTVFPWATLLVNILGCLLIGVVYGVSERSNLLTPEWRIFLTVGLLGGFTTFSTFSNDAFMLLQNKEILRFAMYTGFSFFFGILAVFTGRGIIKIL
ncbi:MAG: fluoride efflux transporter CrcB [Bacteroidales bacterium]